MLGVLAGAAWDILKYNDFERLRWAFHEIITLLGSVGSA